MFRNKKKTRKTAISSVAARENIVPQRAGFLLVAVLLLAGIERAEGAMITVGPGTDYDCNTIQTAIDAANNSDTVLVAPGEYAITDPITFRGKAITVRSEAGRDETTIRMGTPLDSNRGSVVVFENDETAASVLDGFTLTGGRGSQVSSLTSTSLLGGGILFDASFGTVRNCAIVENSAKHGGGVQAASGASPSLTGCTIRGNSATAFGGGVFCYKDSSVTMTDCIISGNSVTGAILHQAGYGGGLCCTEDSSLKVANCTISENSAGLGGGAVFCAVRASVNMAKCVVTENSAPRIGGAVFCEQNSSATFTNCVISGNSAAGAGGDGGAVHCWNSSLLTVVNCTIIGNSATNDRGGIVGASGSSGTVTNSIIRGNTTTQKCEISLLSGSTLSIIYDNIAGGRTGVNVEGSSTLDCGAGNIDTDPYFADPSNGDYHLKSQAGRWDPNNQVWVQDDVTSPCIDAGDPMSPIGWESFPNGGFVNIGAYGSTTKASKTYFGEPVCGTIVAGDINGDGQVNRTDLEIMALHWTDEEPLPLL